jgi:hypothetical protein
MFANEAFVDAIESPAQGVSAEGVALAASPVARPRAEAVRGDRPGRLVARARERRRVAIPDLENLGAAHHARRRHARGRGALRRNGGLLVMAVNGAAARRAS